MGVFAHTHKVRATIRPGDEARQVLLCDHITCTPVGPGVPALPGSPLNP